MNQNNYYSQNDWTTFPDQVSSPAGGPLPAPPSLEEVKFWLNLIEGHSERMGHCFRGVMREMIERVGIAQRLKKE